MAPLLGWFLSPRLPLYLTTLTFVIHWSVIWCFCGLLTKKKPARTPRCSIREQLHVPHPCFVFFEWWRRFSKAKLRYSSRERAELARKWLPVRSTNTQPEAVGRLLL